MKAMKDTKGANMWWENAKDFTVYNLWAVKTIEAHDDQVQHRERLRGWRYRSKYKEQICLLVKFFAQRSDYVKKKDITDPPLGQLNLQEQQLQTSAC